SSPGACTTPSTRSGATSATATTPKRPIRRWPRPWRCSAARSRQRIADRPRPEPVVAERLVTGADGRPQILGGGARERAAFGSVASRAVEQRPERLRHGQALLLHRAVDEHLHEL